MEETSWHLRPYLFCGGFNPYLGLPRYVGKKDPTMGRDMPSKNSFVASGESTLTL